MKYFEHLSAEEIQTLTDAPVLITILVGGADGNLDQAELDWANHLTEIRGYSHNESLRGYYDLVHVNFPEKINAALAALPAEQADREAAISERLSAINDILPKVDPSVAYRFYSSMLSFAGHIAKASGGFMRFMSVSGAEANWLSLSMLNPVAQPEGEGEAHDAE